MSMFGKEKPGDRYAPAASPQPQPQVVTRPASAPDSETISSIGPDVTIVGKIAGKGVVKVFGRIEGELQASNIHVHEGAHIEGNVVAQELTVGGLVKGTIHAVRVKLLGTAKVEGDIFHRSLSIEENALFEGSSRREDDPTSKQPASPPKPQPQAQAPVQVQPQPISAAQAASVASAGQVPPLAARVTSIDAN